ncbi:hypothetical protein QVD17_07187 [Tagetes erecta]|uniref:Transmembrane protein n=1 Tax=Tagetes erecta TaxID=13708 RepID=A0AAD8LID5_TARER|nr:hypothetical protein QVD17_07187 [Tagetes erecta]
MASTSFPLLFTILIAIFTISTSARPCKTIFFITSSSPFPINNHNLPKPRLTFLITQIQQFHRTRSLPRPMLFDQSIITSSSSEVISSSIKASIQERTMDIMSIVGAVLFGVGCGALTAATMYLFWSLFVPQRFEFGSDSEESSDEENDVRGDQKDGYFVVANVVKEDPPSANEVDRFVAMK